MRWVVLYDVRDARRLRRVARLLEGYGERVQHSVFECELADPDLAELRAGLAKLVREDEDRIHFFPLCGKDQAAVRVLGCARRPPPLGPIFV